MKEYLLAGSATSLVIATFMIVEGRPVTSFLFILIGLAIAYIAKML